MYLLMNKDNVIASFNFGKVLGQDVTVGLNVRGRLPYGCDERNFSAWLQSRYAAKHRSHLAGYLNTMQADTLKGFVELTHSVSINDTYWVKEEHENIHWSDVSLYTNEFDEVIQRMSFDGIGLRGVQMTSTSPEFGTAGAYEKCWKKEEDGIYLYKRGTEGFSNAGLEPYSEVLASFIFYKLGIGIPYELVHFHKKVASKCRLFNNEKVGFVPYAVVQNANDSLAEIVKMYSTNGWLDDLYGMIVCDAIVFNTDRHMGNFGFLFDTETLELLCPAPCFDYNLALFPMEVNDAFADVNAFINKYTPKLGDRFVVTAREALTSELRSRLIALRGFEYPDISDDKFTKSRIDWLTQLSNQQIDKLLDVDKTDVYISPNKDAISNIYRYQIQNHMTQEQFQDDVPRLMKLFGIQHMAELEEKIVDLLN